MATRQLVIGFGNELRSDDGLGPRIARAVDTWRLPAVLVLAVHQLTPELAEPVAQANRVFFIDASLDCFLAPVSAEKIEVDMALSLNPHSSDPKQLLFLAHQLYGNAPEAWLFRVRATTLDYGDALSESAQHSMSEALDWLRERLTRG